MSKKIEATEVKATHVTPVYQEVQIPEGKAYIIPIKEGTEQPHLGFFVSIATADKSFTDTQRFTVKKNIPLN